jgi:hypothetical protein
MKRFLLLAAALLIGAVPAYASTAAPVTLEYGQIETILSRQSLSLGVMEHRIRSLNSQEQNIGGGASGIGAMSASLAGMQSALEASDDPLIKGILANQIMLLQMNIQSAAGAMAGADNAQRQLDDTRNTLRTQRTRTLDALTFSAQQAFISYYKLLELKDQLQVQMSEVARQQGAMRRRIELGFLPASAMDMLNDADKALRDALSNVDDQSSSLLLDIKLILGYDLSAGILLGELPEFEAPPFSSFKYDNRDFVRNSHDVRDARERRSRAVRDLNRNTDSDVRIAELEVELAVANAERAYDRVYNTLKSAYQRVSDAEKELADAQRSFRRLQSRHSVGMASLSQLNAQSAEVKRLESGLELVNIDLRLAVLVYDNALNGVTLASR